MKHVFTLLMMLLMVGTSLTAQRNCSSMDYLEHQLEHNPTMQLNMDAIERFTREYVSGPTREMNGNILTIPVIVHVVYQNNTENISDNQINSQMQVLNEDFRRTNADASDTPSDFVGVAADTEIEFCLTQVIRQPTSVSSFGTNDSVKFSSSGGSDVVTPSQALNIWVCEIGGGILGYAQFPGGSASTDGVVVDYRYFGTIGTATAPFDLGRTTTHEVGHWLNLRHIWGDGPCNVDDFVSDTPNASGPNYTGSPCTYPGPNSCKPKGNPNNSNDLPDMFQNYMDYSDDVCMNLFTVGQKDRMWAAINSARPGLITASCDGTNPPNDPEICDNGIDDDGDGAVDCDDSDCSAAVNCQPTGSCDAPTGLTHTRRKGGKEALLEWDAVSGATDYDVEVYDNTGALHASGNVTSNSAIVGGLTKDEYYTWRVRANCSNGTTSDWSNSDFYARLAGNAFAAHTEALLAYPNPTNQDQISIIWDLPSDLSASISEYEGVVKQEGEIVVRIMDMTGKVMVNLNTDAAPGSTQVNVSTLVPGLYLIQVTNDKGYQESIKFVKL